MKSALARLSLVFGVFLLVLLSTGCATPVIPTGYLDEYETFNAIDQDNLRMRVANDEDFTADDDWMSQLAAAADAGTTPTLDTEQYQPTLFIVPKPEWLAECDLSDEDREDVLFTIRERLYRYLLRQYPSPVRVRYAYDPREKALSGYRVVTFETAVTNFTPGIAFTRYVIGYGLGQATIQIEGRLYEGANRDLLLAEFAVREGHGGYPNGFINTRVLESAYCACYAVDQAFEKFMPRVRLYVPGVRDRESSPAMHIVSAHPWPYLTVRGDRFRRYLD